MGIIKSDEACPWDNNCWLPGCTPKYIVGAVYGVEYEAYSPSLPPCPNGIIDLVQIDEFNWQRNKDGWTHTLTLTPLSSGYQIVHDLGYLSFRQIVSETCLKVFESDITGYYYKNGIATMGWFGPAGSESYIQQLITDFNLPAPLKVQADINGSSDLKKTVRLSNLFDGTRVYIKST